MADASTTAAESRPGAARYHPLVLVLVAACAGIVADRWLELPLGLCWTASAGMWVVWLVAWRRGRIAAGSVVLLGAVAWGAAGWHHGQACLFAEDDLAHYARSGQEPVCVEAVVTGTPQRLPAPALDPLRAIPQVDRTRVELDARAIRDGVRWQTAAGRVRLTVDGHLLGVHVGDRLRVFGQLSTIRPPENPGQFDYAAAERIHRRRCRLWAEFPDGVTVIASGRWWSPARLLERMRCAADRILAERLPESRYPLATALLLGRREELGGEGTDPFLETGTIHLLSISGLHVGIIAGAILGLMRLLRVPQRRSMASVAVMTTLYTLLTGAQPPAVRALILVLVFCGSTCLYRPSRPFNSLAAAALVVLALNPAHLFSIGVQLSFLAVAGLFGGVPRWFEARKEDPVERLVRESQGWLARAGRSLGRRAWRLAGVSLVIWLLTMPLVMARFHLLQPAGLALNLLLWGPVPVVLVSGFGLVGLGWLCPPLAGAFGWVCAVSLGLLSWLVETARTVPGNHLWVPGPADWWLAGFYGGLAILAALPTRRPPRRWCLALLAGWTAVGFGAGFWHGSRDRLEATFLSVGHGCAVVLQLPNGTTMLYDAGQFASPESGAESIAGCLWSKGIMHLDAVVLSHADADHYNALPALLERFSVGVVYVSPVMFVKEDDRALQVLRGAIARAGVPLREVFGGDRLDGGPGCRIEVFHPPRRGILGSDNANSIVLAVEYLGHRLLLPGDLAAPGLDDVVAEEPWDCDVLLAPHHGSRLSDPPGLAAWCKPEWVVISGGHRWDIRDTIVQYHVAGSQILHTAEAGAVRVRIRAGELAVEPVMRQQ